MCGIIGLLIKNSSLRDRLGALMVPMLVGMSERGPDSAGLAVYTDAGARRAAQAESVQRRAVRLTGGDCSKICAGNSGMRKMPPFTPITRCSSQRPTRTPLPVGFCGTRRRLRCFPSGARSICTRMWARRPRSPSRYRFNALNGTHVVGHTRMATESAVTPAHAHPFTRGPGLLPRTQRFPVESASGAQAVGTARDRIRNGQRHRGGLPLLRMAVAGRG